MMYIFYTLYLLKKKHFNVHRDRNQTKWTCNTIESTEQNHEAGKRRNKGKRGTQKSIIVFSRQDLKVGRTYVYLLYLLIIYIYICIYVYMCVCVCVLHTKALNTLLNLEKIEESSGDVKEPPKCF